MLMYSSSNFYNILTFKGNATKKLLINKILYVVKFVNKFLHDNLAAYGLHDYVLVLGWCWGEVVLGPEGETHRDTLFTNPPFLPRLELSDDEIGILAAYGASG